MNVKPIDLDLFETMYADSDLTITDIANRFRISCDTVTRHAATLGLPPRGPIFRPPASDPTPEEILQRTAEIRKGWSPQERSRRYVGPKGTQWEAPSYSFDGRIISFSS